MPCILFLRNIMGFLGPKYIYIYTRSNLLKIKIEHNQIRLESKVNTTF